LRGVHNLQNALAAVSVCVALGISMPSIEEGIKAFKPLPHRLQLVDKKENIPFYNDSLATTPESAVAALRAFDKPIVLIAGGYDKQVDLNSFAYEMTRQCKFVLLIGETADTISIELDQYNYLSYEIFDTIEDAFARAVEQAEEGDIILLSPGCASYGMFCNFAERGERFVELVDGLT
ncbi:UDP-N-acetylmuramoylalanine--D-glutamate ligase, partial [hydrothermal vent metagenome]